MNTQELIDTARTLVAGDKGLLAMDESNPTCNKRFAALGIPQAEEARSADTPPPEIVLPTPQWFHDFHPKIDCRCGFKASCNPTNPNESGSEHGWVSPFHFGLNQEPIV